MAISATSASNDGTDRARRRSRGARSRLFEPATNRPSGARCAPASREPVGGGWVGWSVRDTRCPAGRSTGDGAASWPGMGSPTGVILVLPAEATILSRPIFGLPRRTDAPTVQQAGTQQDDAVPSPRAHQGWPLPTTASPDARAMSRVLARLPEIELVSVSSDGDQLLEAVVLTQPDVVLTDIRMPPSRSNEGIQAAHRASRQPSDRRRRRPQPVRRADLRARAPRRSAPTVAAIC